MPAAKPYLGIVIRDLREAVPLTLDGLAQASGVSRDVIHNLETGRQTGTSSDKAPRLAAALHTTWDAILAEARRLETEAARRRRRTEGGGAAPQPPLKANGTPAITDVPNDRGAPDLQESAGLQLTPPLPSARLRRLVARAAEDVLTAVREEGLPDDDPQAIALEIASAFAQLEEAARHAARPVTVRLGGKVIQLPRRSRPDPAL